MKPVIHETAFVADNATVRGNVTIGEGAGIYFGAVLRAETDPITIGPGANIQDNCVLHADPGFPTSVGRDCTVGHAAILHGCTIGDNTLVGMGAIVLNGAVVGRDCIIAAGALVTQGAVIPDGSMVMGAPGKVRRSLTPEEIASVELATGAPESLQQETAEGLTLESTLGTDSPEERMVEHIALREAIDQLPEREKMTILLRFFKGLTQEQTARILGVSQVQISRLERRGLADLRRLLDG
mgnify:CR=1 FL=1